MVRVFCDFDGTVCPQDVGELFFRNFAGPQAEADVQRLLHGDITMQQWLDGLCNAIPVTTLETFAAFVDQFSVDPYFAEFVKFCRTKEASVSIVSDGLDFYIQHLLQKSGLMQVPSFANHVEFVPVNGGQKLITSFPYTDAECHLCGNCKRNHMLTTSADDDIIVYVGDGYSDRCPIRYADFVFAKRHLVKYCQEQNITYFDFSHFGDVQQKMEEILSRKRIRHRQEAAMARREVFMQG